MSEKFPLRQEDGSFLVNANFECRNENKTLSTNNLDQWLTSWVERNNPWVRHWFSGNEEELNFFDEFKTARVRLTFLVA